MRLREIKKYGDSFVIKLFPIDLQDFNLSVGDTVDIEDLVIIKQQKEEKRWKNLENPFIRFW